MTLNLPKNVEGISAVKALKLASEQGQKIYKIDSKNMNTMMSLITHDAELTQDIRNAVASGKVVTVSEKSITLMVGKAVAISFLTQIQVAGLI